MTPGQLLLEGLELMLYGMGSVLAFLMLLVLFIRVMSRLIERFAPEHPAQPASGRVAAPVPVRHDMPDGELLAAIQMAIHQHRARRD